MKKWQEKRNYKRLKDEQGNVIANIITVDGQDVKVSDEVFKTYTRADRRERYISEEVEPGIVLSLDRLMEDSVPLDTLGVPQVASAEDSLLNQEKLTEKEVQIKKIRIALESLATDEKQLIQALYFDCTSAREYARHLGVQLRTIQYRRDKILEKLRQKIFSDFC